MYTKLMILCILLFVIYATVCFNTAFVLFDNFSAADQLADLNYSTLSLFTFLGGIYKFKNL